MFVLIGERTQGVCQSTATTHNVAHIPRLQRRIGVDETARVDDTLALKLLDVV